MKNTVSSSNENGNGEGEYVAVRQEIIVCRVSSPVHNLSLRGYLQQKPDNEWSD